MARDRASNGSGERTEEERERAREERERRRLERAAAIRVEPPLPPPLEDPGPVGEVPTNVPSIGDTRPSPALEPELPTPVNVQQGRLQQEHVQQGRTQEYAQPAAVPFEPSSGFASSSPWLHPLRSQLHRPHLHRSAAVGRRGPAAAIGAMLALIVVLGALAVGAVLVFHHKARPKIIPAPMIVKVVIPEGFTRAQIAALAHEDGLRGSYLAPSKRSSEIDFSHYGAPEDTPSLEGFLFPATYEMYVGAPASQLVSDQLTAFRENFGGGEIHRAKVLGVTPYQLLIVASIIEREAAVAHDRPLVAAVIYNRLHLGMTLGIDSTLRYALHDFTSPLTESQLHSDSPYNTRTHAGLPPTPISNPGAAAITAAGHPARVSYLYYVAAADGCGEQVFSTSYTQFEKNAAAYHEALAKNGGRVPTCKKK